MDLTSISHGLAMSSAIPDLPVSMYFKVTLSFVLKVCIVALVFSVAERMLACEHTAVRRREWCLHMFCGLRKPR
jgi:hypothetical protein